MTDKERLETIKELVKKIESILYDEWRQQELTFLIESLYYAGHVEWLIKQAERAQELEKQNYNLKESTYKMQMDFIDANKYRNIYKEQNKRYRKAIENIKKYNQKALKVDDYTKNEALLDISLEIMKLEGEVNE